MIASCGCTSCSGRNNVSRCAAIQIFPAVPGRAVPLMCPAATRRVSGVVPFENDHGKMKAENLHSSDRFSKARRNHHESVWKHWSVVGQLPVARLLLIDEPTDRPLRAEHIELDIRIPGKSECAPYDEGAPEIGE